MYFIFFTVPFPVKSFSPNPTSTSTSTSKPKPPSYLSLLAKAPPPEEVSPGSPQISITSTDHPLYWKEYESGSSNSCEISAMLESLTLTSPELNLPVESLYSSINIEEFDPLRPSTPDDSLLFDSKPVSHHQQELIAPNPQGELHTKADTDVIDFDTPIGTSYSSAVGKFDPLLHTSNNIFSYGSRRVVRRRVISHSTRSSPPVPPSSSTSKGSIVNVVFIFRTPFG